MLYHDARANRLHAYDGRETAPAAAKADRFLTGEGKPMPFLAAVIGGRSVGVPGVLRMLELAHARHGRLTWAKLFTPAIRLAREGFPVSPRLHSLLERVEVRNPSARRYFYDAEGKPWPVGYRLRNPDLADTLERVAREGPDAFYTGPIARDIAAAVTGYAGNPGDLTEEDLARYRAKERDPLCGRYRIYRVCGVPPPSSGAVTVLEMLGVLERFDLAAVPPDSALAVHLFSEAGRLAFADRNRYLADPDFVAVPAHALIAPEYLEERALAIRADRSLGVAAPGVPDARKAARFADDTALELPSTSHFSIVDRYGNAVAMTSSIEFAFGSQIMVHGFLLNNQLTDFSFLPEQDGLPAANRVEAGKRPRSSMAPTIVYDAAGRVLLLTGSSGGSAILNHVAKNLVGVLDWRLDLQSALDLPNVGSRNGPTELESETPAVALRGKLEALGHEVRIGEQNSGLHAVQRAKTGWIGAADSRREGAVLGD
jgi:gamma-glutamyltranspeptidase/glutathione hydrolase